MSHVPLEATQSTCQVDIFLSGTAPIGSMTTVDEALKLHAGAAYEELGDELLGTEETLHEIRRRTGVTLANEQIRMAIHSVQNCLKQRYMGQCAISGHCTGRAFVDQKLEALGIQRFKDDQSEYV